MSNIQEFVDSVFSTYDADNSGSLEKSEARNFLRDLFKAMEVDVDGDQINYVIQKIDDSGDGTISKEELVDMVREAMESC